MDEADWFNASPAKDFYMVLPMDTSMANVRTEVRMAYDDKHLYLIAVCYTALPGPYMVESLRRDFAFGKNDNFLLFMDPFDDQTNGFSFGANAAGAQWDGLMYEGGKVDLSWDNKWTSVVKNYDDKWVFEAAIPFKSIRFKKGITRWGINFSRLDLKTTEKSSWAPVPRRTTSQSMSPIKYAFCGEMMRGLYEALPAKRRGAYAKTSEQLAPLLTKGVGAGDVVMIKGSFGSRMAPLVEALQRHFQAPSKAAQA